MSKQITMKNYLIYHRINGRSHKSYTVRAERLLTTSAEALALALSVSPELGQDWPEQSPHNDGYRLVRPHASLRNETLTILPDHGRDRLDNLIARCAKKGARTRDMKILVNSWGYDQTNIDFFLVLDESEDTATLAAIDAAVVSSDSMTRPTLIFFCGSCVPDLYTAPFEISLYRAVRKNAGTEQETYVSSVGMSRASCLVRWDGRPEFFSSWA